MSLSVWSDGEDWVIAESASDATAVWTEHYGEPAEDLHWLRLADDRMVFIVEDVESDDGYEDMTRRVTKTCAEWIAQNGRGWLCSVNY